SKSLTGMPAAPRGRKASLLAPRYHYEFLVNSHIPSREENVMKWIICLGILATSVSPCHASETWEVDSDSLKEFEAHLLAFDTLLVNGDTKGGAARLIETLLDQRSHSQVRIAAIG